MKHSSSPRNRLGAILQWCSGKQLTLHVAPDPWYSFGMKVLANTASSPNDLHLPPDAKSLCSTPTPFPVVAATDGSTAEGKSGIGICLLSPNEIPSTGLKFGIPSPTPGNNYLAEAAAIFMTLQICPINCPLTLISDSLSCLQAITTEKKRSERNRIHRGGRAVVASILKAIEARSAPLTLRFVRSHTSRLDMPSQANDVADRLANEGRNNAPEDPPDFLVNEERVYWRESKKHVSGNLRDLLKTMMINRHLSILRGCLVQGFLAATARSTLLDQIKFVRRLQDNDMLSFFMCAACQWLPTLQRVSKFAKGTEGWCRHCFITTIETVPHVFTCPSQDANREKLYLELEQLCSESNLLPGLESHGLTVRSVFRWWDGTLRGRDRQLPTDMLQRLPSELRDLIKSLSIGNSLAGILGIIPRQIRQIIELLLPQEGIHRKTIAALADAIILRLRKILVTSAFEMWRHRNTLDSKLTPILVKQDKPRPLFKFRHKKLKTPRRKSYPPASRKSNRTFRPSTLLLSHTFIFPSPDPPKPKAPKPRVKFKFTPTVTYF
jgi:hypothetical protein